MTFPIDPSKSARENLLALVNHANSSDITLTDVDLANLQPLDGKAEGERNTSILLDPKAGGRFNVTAGGVTVNYRRLSFAELIQAPVEIKAQRTTTLTEIHQAICNAYGLIPDGVLTEGALPGPGTILPGETFEVTINPSAEGSVVYFPRPQAITITWDGVWLSEVLGTELPGFYAEQQVALVTLDESVVGFTPAMLDAKVLAALGGDWLNPTPIKIRVGTGARILGRPANSGSGQCPIRIDAKYGNRPFILIENHGFIAGSGGYGGSSNFSPTTKNGYPGGSAIEVQSEVCKLLMVDNQGTLIGGGGGGGSDWSRAGGVGAPYSLSDGYGWSLPSTGSNNGAGGNYSGSGGAWGKVGGRGRDSVGGSPGRALDILNYKSGDTVGKWINKGTVYGYAYQ